MCPGVAHLPLDPHLHSAARLIWALVVPLACVLPQCSNIAQASGHSPSLLQSMDALISLQGPMAKAAMCRMAWGPTREA